MKSQFGIFILLILLTSKLNSQSTETYYYYNGIKKSLEINYKAISFVSKSENIGIPLTSEIPFCIKNIQADFSKNSIIQIDPCSYSVENKLSYIGEIELNTLVNHQEYLSFIQNFQLYPNIIKALPTFKINNTNIRISNNFYVKLHTPEDITLLYDLAKQYSIQIIGYNQFMPLWITLSCDQAPYNSLEAANLFHESNQFEYSEPEFLYQDILQSKDPLFYHQWGLRHTGQSGWSPQIDIKAEQAWSITTGSPNIKTAVYDEGIEPTHPDLASNIHGTGYDVITGKESSAVYQSHGISCAGIISAIQNNLVGISGVAPTSKLISISFHYNLYTPQQLANGFNWAWQHHADIISNSWTCSPPSSILDNAIAKALTDGRSGKGCIITFSAGNYDTEIVYPANSHPRLLVVGGISPCGERKSATSCDNDFSWRGSCYGDRLDIMAPSVSIPTTNIRGLNDYILNFGGTSAACPHVAGVAALILSVNPNLSAKEVNDIIEKTAQKTRTDKYIYQNVIGRENGTWNNEMGYGVIDAYEAVKLAQNDISISNTIKSVPTTTNYASQVSHSFNYNNYYTQALKTYTQQEKGIIQIKNLMPKYFKTYTNYPANGKIEIFNIQGITVFCKNFSEAHEVDIDLRNQPSGIYLVKVSLSNEIYSKKIIL